VAYELHRACSIFQKPLRRIFVEEVGGGTPVSGEDVTALSASVGDRLSPRIEVIKSAAPTSSAESSPLATRPVPSQTPPLRSSPQTGDAPEGAGQKQTPVDLGPLPVPPVPVTFLQFQAAVKKLRKHTRSLFAYLRQLDPEKVPVLLKDQLDSVTLVAIIEACAECVVG